MNEIKIINQQEVLSKNFKVYGTFENPLFMANIQFKSGGTWVLYQKYADKGYTSTKTSLSIQ